MPQLSGTDDNHPRQEQGGVRARLALFVLLALLGILVVGHSVARWEADAGASPPMGIRVVDPSQDPG